MFELDCCSTLCRSRRSTLAHGHSSVVSPFQLKYAQGLSVGDKSPDALLYLRAPPPGEARQCESRHSATLCRGSFTIATTVQTLLLLENNWGEGREAPLPSGGKRSCCPEEEKKSTFAHNLPGIYNKHTTEPLGIRCHGKKAGSSVIAHPPTPFTITS